MSSEAMKRLKKSKFGIILTKKKQAFSNDFSVISLGQLYQLNDPRVSAVIVEGDPLPVPANVIMTRSRSQKMGETFTRIPAPSKIIKLFLRELIVGRYNSADAARDVGSASTTGGGDDWEDLEGETEVTPLEGSMPYEDLLKYVNKGDIEDLDGGELYDLDNVKGNSSSATLSRAWAGSDNSTQIMIAGFVKNVAQSDLGGFTNNVFPNLNDEEKACVEDLLK